MSATTACAATPRRLGAAEATVIVVIVLMATVLAIIVLVVQPAEGVLLTLPQVLGPLGAAGLVGAFVVHLAIGGSPLRLVQRTADVLTAPSAQG